MPTQLGRSAKRWAATALPTLACILVPFAIVGDRADGWTSVLLGFSASPHVAFGVVVALLAADVLLPLPSSLISVMSGSLLGAAVGTVASWVGMTLGGLAAYAIGSLAGRPVVSRLVGADQLSALEGDISRYGLAIVALGRAVPVLAEATTLIAGASRMPFGPFFFVIAVSNLGVSVVYACVGAVALGVDSFLMAVLGSTLLPALIWWLAAKVRSRLGFHVVPPR